MLGKLFARAVLWSAILLVVGCGGSGDSGNSLPDGGHPTPAQVSVSVSPDTATVDTDATLAFTATVTGTSDTKVTWSASSGQIDPEGHFTAPGEAGTVTVTATSDADSTVTATATVTVETSASTTSVSISPKSASVRVGGQLQFSAKVNGTASADVEWSADVGSVDGNGLFTAPATAGTAHVTVTSRADSSQSATAVVEVSSKPVLTVTPVSGSVMEGGTLQLTAKLDGQAETDVTWSTDVGSISASGLFTAPQSTGTAHITVVDNTGKADSAQATVSIKAKPSLTVTPSTASVSGGGTVQLTAKLDGQVDTDVTWSTDFGSINVSGLFTAPQAAGTAHITVADNTGEADSAQATVTVSAPTSIQVSISPDSATASAGETLRFTATVTGSADTGIVWSADNGSISQDGAWTAPSTGGTFHVKATSHADSSKSAQATIAVAAPSGVTVIVNPQSINATEGDTIGFHFVATVSGATNGGVTWSLEEANCGTLDQNGIYMPPPAHSYPLTCHVVATSKDDPSAKGTAVAHNWPDMLDHGGPVVPNVKAYVVWWGEPSAFAADDHEVVEGFLNGLSGTPYLEGIYQYTRGATPQVTLGGSWQGDTLPPPDDSTLDADAMTAVACNALRDHGVTPDEHTVVIVDSTTVNSRGSYCGLHTNITCDGVTIPYIYLPNQANCAYYQPVCGTSHTQEAMATVRDISHEVLETMTNPYGSAWYSGSEVEVADKCGVGACVTFSDGTYSLTDYYSNRDHACVMESPLP
jgi:hypothetical protein